MQILHQSSTDLERMRQDTGASFRSMLAGFVEQTSLQDDRLEHSSNMALELMRTLDIARKGQMEAFKETSSGLRIVREELVSLCHHHLSAKRRTGLPLDRPLS